MMKKRIRVYIAGPYSQGDVGANVSNAMDVWHQLYDFGMSPYCPHLSHYLHVHKPLPYEDWLEYDKDWLPMCEALYRMIGESKGADDEVKIAMSLGIPVFHDVEKLREWSRPKATNG